MRTNIDIDEDLMLKAQKLTNIKTKKAVVEKALQLLVQVENQHKVLDFWGEISINDKAVE